MKNSHCPDKKNPCGYRHPHDHPKKGVLGIHLKLEPVGVDLGGAMLTPIPSPPGEEYTIRGTGRPPKLDDV